MSRVNCWFFHRLCLVHHQAANTWFYCMSWPWLLDPSSILVVTVEVTRWTKPPLHKLYSRVRCFSELFNCLAGVNLLKRRFSTFSRRRIRLLTPSSLNYFKEINFTGPGSVILLFLSTNPCKLTSLGFPTPRLKTSVWMVTCGVGLTRSNKGGESI